MSTPPPTLEVTADDVTHYIDSLLHLVEQEALAESSAASSSGITLSQLAQKGLALSPLSASKTSVGLGGRTLIELQRSAAVGGGSLGDHRFTQGDLVSIEDAGDGSTKKAAVNGKGKEKDASFLGLEGTVWKVSEGKIVLALGGGGATNEQEIELPERIRLHAFPLLSGLCPANELVDRVRLSNPATTNRQIQHLKSLKRFIFPSSSASTSLPDSLPSLLKVLLGVSSPKARPVTSSPQEAGPSEMLYFDSRLNRSQKDAVRWIVQESGEASLLWGPPGTGKTQTLIELIRQFVLSNPNSKILVCGASNLAIDNLLSRLLMPPPLAADPDTPLSPPEIRATRLGDPVRSLPALIGHTLASQSFASTSEVLSGVKEDLEALEKSLLTKGKVKGRKARELKWKEVRDLRKEYRVREGKGVESVLKAANVVVGTCHSAGGKNLEKVWFDLVIIDEAAQCSEPSAWIPLSRLREGGRLVLAGDDMQLPPTVLAEGGREGRTLRAMKPENIHSCKVSESHSAPSEPKPRESVKKDRPIDADEAKEAVQSLAVDAGAADSIQTSGCQSSDDVSLERLTVDAPEPSPSPATLMESAQSPSTANDPHTISNDELPSASSTIVTPKRHISRTSLPPAQSLSQTLFTRLHLLHGPSIRQMLTVQYRFNSKICSFPSQALYNGELVADSGVAARKLDDIEDWHGDEEDEVVFIDTADLAMYERTLPGGSKVNENEVTLVQQYVTSLIDAGLPPSKIAIISPYSAQVSLLASTLHPLHPELEIGSIDGFQGREQEVVIITLVRSNAEGEVGFLADKRRLNVAMTRAKRQLVVVGDSGTVKRGSAYLKSWMAWLEAEAEVRVADLG